MRVFRKQASAPPRAGSDQPGAAQQLCSKLTGFITLQPSCSNDADDCGADASASTTACGRGYTCSACTTQSTPHTTTTPGQQHAVSGPAFSGTAACGVMLPQFQDNHSRQAQLQSKCRRRRCHITPPSHTRTCSCAQCTGWTASGSGHSVDCCSTVSASSLNRASGTSSSTAEQGEGKQQRAKAVRQSRQCGCLPTPLLLCSVFGLALQSGACARLMEVAASVSQHATQLLHVQGVCVCVRSAQLTWWGHQAAAAHVFQEVVSAGAAHDEAQHRVRHNLTACSKPSRRGRSDCTVQ